MPAEFCRPEVVTLVRLGLFQKVPVSELGPGPVYVRHLVSGRENIDGRAGYLPVGNRQHAAGESQRAGLRVIGQVGPAGAERASARERRRDAGGQLQRAGDR